MDGAPGPAPSVWTVYAFPRDFPRNYVARRFELPDGITAGPRPTEDLMICPFLEPVRARLRALGLKQHAREEEDDPVILETWY